MSAAVPHALISPFDPALVILGGQRGDLLFGQADLVAGLGQADGPHAGVEAFVDAGQRVVDFDAGFHWIDAQVSGVFEAHPGLGPAGGHLGSTNGRVGFVAAFFGLTLEDVHHLAGVAGGRADLVAALSAGRDGFEAAGDQFGVVGQAVELERHELLEHGLDVVVVRRCALDLLPAFGDGGILGDLADVDSLVGAHRLAGFLDADFDAFALEDLLKHDGGGVAAVVHGCAGPVEDDGLDGAGVVSFEAECVGFHGGCSCGLFVGGRSMPEFSCAPGRTGFLRGGRQGTARRKPRSRIRSRRHARSVSIRIRSVCRWCGRSCRWW